MSRHLDFKGPASGDFVPMSYEEVSTMSGVKQAGKRQSLVALDALNVFLADVRDGLGPYLAIILRTRGWDPGRVGIVLSAMGFASVLAQTPAGALIDGTRHKRTTIVLAAMAVALGCVAMALWPSFGVILTSQAMVGMAAAVFAPAIAAISLGLVGHDRMARRMGRNEAFNHAGNVSAALLAGFVGDHVAMEGIFYLVAAMAVATIITTSFIRSHDIDYALSRGAVEDTGDSLKVEGFLTVLKDRRILVFIVSVTLFHFANAAMLPLVGQKLTEGKSSGVSSDMSACIITAQLVMVPVSLLASRFAQSWGRRSVFLIAFAVLPVRGMLYTLSTNPAFLVAVQFLDGIGAGIEGVVSVLVIADLTRGTGRFNLFLGVKATAVGLGASASNLLTGFAVKAAGFDAAFVGLSGIAAAALLFFTFTMPETQHLSMKNEVVGSESDQPLPQS